MGEAVWWSVQGSIVMTQSSLIEMLAEAVHEEWVRGRKAEGWTYGEKRDDDAKTNPCMVPYAELPESEKEYDRATATTTINTLSNAGFRIDRAA